MKLFHGVVASAAAIGIVIGICGFAGQSAANVPVPVIVTAAPEYDALAGLRGEERFRHGAQLLWVEHGKAEPLVPGFAASADASVSFDGKKVLFAGKKQAGDRWAVWELTLGNRAVRVVVGGDADAVRPLYLPDGRLVFARRDVHGFAMETAALDGSDVQALSYLQASALPSDVLADGRILFEAMYPLGTGTTPEMFLVYADGSGVESYRCDHGTPRWGGRQLTSGDVVFTEGKTLARFTSPLANEARVVAPVAEYAGVVEVNEREWLVSAREPGSKYELQTWVTGAVALKPLLTRVDEDLVEPVLVRERERPHRHPSGLHDWDYANLLALDARESREGDLKQTPATVRLEAMDAHGNAVSMGSAPVESDGSFFVKAPADRPIRFALLDGSGAVMRQENGWFWIRKGEQRICVGCHTGPERASENRVPAVLVRSTTAADLTGGNKQTVAGSR